jgi:cytochrome P450
MSIARNNHKFYRDHIAKYGPVFKTRLFGVNFVIVSGHEAFHQFATDPRVQRGGTDPVSVEQMFHGSLALVDGDEHHAR